MVAARQLESHPGIVAEDLRKHVIRLLQVNGEEPKGNILVLPQVFLEFLDYDHKRAIFLNKLLYWTERTKHPQKWIYKTYHDWYQELGLKESVIRRLLYGDPRARTRKRTLADIGVESVVRRAPNGSPTCHYRLNLDLFLASIQRFLAEKQGDEFTSVPTHCTESNPCNEEAGNLELQAIESLQCAETLDHITTTQSPSEGNTSESSYTLTRDDDLSLFFCYEKRFGKLKDRWLGIFRAELTRLGASRVGEVLDRCASRGRSWAYVQKALANEPATAQTEFVTDWGEGVYTGQEGEQNVPLQPQEAIPALCISERVATPWQGASEAGTTVQTAWQAAYHQLEMQLDHGSFESWVRSARLVDFEPETMTFVLVARTAMAQKMLEGKLDRMIKRVLGDVYGQAAEVKYLLTEEWIGQDEQSA